MSASQLISRENNIAQIKVELSADDVAQTYKQIYKEYAKSLKVPGFRKGHIPSSVIKNRIGEDEINGIASEQLREHAVRLALSELKLTPRQGRTKWISEAEPKEGEGLSLEFALPILPEVKLPDFASFQLTVPVLDVTDGMKERFRERLAERFTTYPEREGVSDENSAVSISIHSHYKESGEESPLHVHELNYVIGRDGNLPGWDEHFIGKSAGDKVSFDYLMPENFADQRLAGKEVGIEAEIHKVLSVQPAEINEEFIQQQLHMTSMEQFEDFVSSSLTSERDNQLMQMKIDLSVQKAIDEIEIDITDDMLDSELDGLIKENDRSMREYGSSLDSYLKEKGQDIKDYRESLRVPAINRIKSFMLVKELSEQQNFEVTPQEFQRFLLSLMQSEGMTEADLRQLMQRQEFINDVHYQIIRHKSFEHIANTAKFNEVVKSEEEYAAEIRAQEEEAACSPEQA
jgi:trigger factor